MIYAPTMTDSVSPYWIINDKQDLNLWGFLVELEKPSEDSAINLKQIMTVSLFNLHTAPNKTAGHKKIFTTKIKSLIFYKKNISLSSKE